MAKLEGPPPFKFRKERGHLVPASAWDQERLDTYRDGAILTAHVTQEKSRPLERKYWAILHEVIEKCGTRFRSAENLHKAIRFSLGVIDAFEDADGNLQAELRSTTKMQEPEYRQYFDEAMGFLHHMTGVDPLTLHNESADVGEDEPEPQQQTSSPADAQGGDALPSSRPVAAANSEESAASVRYHSQKADHGGLPALSSQSEAGQRELSGLANHPASVPGADSEAGDNQKEADGPSSTSASPIDPLKRMLMEECIDNMLRDAFSEPAIDRPAKVDKLRDVFLEKQNLGDFADFVNRCHETARRIIGKPAERDRAREYLISKVPT